MAPTMAPTEAPAMTAALVGAALVDDDALAGRYEAEGVCVRVGDGDGEAPTESVCDGEPLAASVSGQEAEGTK